MTKKFILHSHLIAKWLAGSNPTTYKKGAPFGGARVAGEKIFASAVHGFAVQIDVETFDFDLAADAQSDDEINRLQDDESDRAAI